MLNLVPVSAEGMLEKPECFHDGKVDKDALVSFIRDIKKNTKLSDEDAAVIAASKVRVEGCIKAATQQRRGDRSAIL